MKITLVRHGEVIEKYHGCYNGHIDIGLSHKGFLQAQEVAQKLRYEKFDMIYCSDLLRTKQTLQAFRYDINPIFTKKLREKSWGKHEGKSFEEITQEGLEYKNFHQWLDALDGEDIETFEQNLKKYFFQTILKQKAQNILIVTHSGVIKTIFKILDNLTLEEAFSIKVAYGSFVVLDTSCYNISKKDMD